MSDNSTLPGTGDVYASDDIGGVKFPRVKLIYGSDGNNAGDVASDNPLPVAIPSGVFLSAPSGLRTFVPSLISVAVPSLATVGFQTGIIQVVAPSGLAVTGSLSATVGSGTFVGVTASGLPVTPSNPLAVSVPSLLPVSVPSLVNVGFATAIHQVVAPSGLRALVPSLVNVGFATGIMQIVAPSGLAVTGNLSASIGTGTFVGLTASGLPVASGNPLPVTVVSGGDGSVQGVDAHDSAVTADPLTIGGYASAAAPTDVSGDGDATRAWFLRNGAQMVGLQAAGALIGAGAGAAATALRVTLATDQTPVPVAQATGGQFLVTSRQATGTVHNVAQASGAQFLVTARQATGTSFLIDQATGTTLRVAPNSIEAHGFNPTGGPFLQGLTANGRDPVAVASGAVVRAYSDTVGKQVVMPGAPISMRVNGMAGVQGTGSRTIIPAQGSGISIAIGGVLAVNGSPTFASKMVLHDGTTTLMAGYCVQGGGGFAPNAQFPIVSAPNAAIQAVNLATGADIDVTVWGYKVTNP
jgi:hypothetical protein